MARVADHLIALWDGQSPGTRVLIEPADAHLAADAVHVHEYR